MSGTSRSAVRGAPRPGRSTVLLPLLFAAIFGAVSPTVARADEGIAGQVTSTETGEPLPYANIVYTRTDLPAGMPATPRGKLADRLGNFRILTEPGAYDVRIIYIGRSSFDSSTVVVSAGQMTRLDAKLGIRAIQVETIKISSTIVKNQDAAVLAQRQRAAAVSDGISAQQIKASTDANAAEVVTRVTGVSVVDGKYVYVRGLGERYSTAQVNGSTVASPEANRRVLPFDIFPSGFLENVVIQKTYTPDQPGEFGGGAVNVTTLDFPSQRAWSLSLSSGAHNSTTGKAFGTYSGGERDYLGFDDGFREIPSLIQEVAKDKPVRLRGIASPAGFTPAEVEKMGEAFNKVWSPSEDTARPAYNFAGSFGDEYSLLGRSIGVIAAATLNNSFKTYDYHSTDYQSYNQDGELEVLNDFDVDRSSAETLLGGLVNTGLRVSDDHTVNFRAMYNRSSEDQVRQVEGPTSDLPIRQTRLRFVERGLFTGSAGARHELPFLNDARVDWRAEVSHAEQNEPDRRQYEYELRERVSDEGDTTEVWELSRRSSSKGFTRSFSTLDDTERNYAANFLLPFRAWGSTDSQWKLGWALKNKDRDSAIRRFGFRHPQVRPPDFTLSPEELLVDENIGGTSTTFRLEELTRASDAYVAHHDVQAAYSMVDVPVGAKLRLIGGARLEKSDLRVVTRSPLVNADPEVGQIAESDVLPAGNLRFAVTDKVNVRAAYSRTLNRPDLRELTSQDYTDYDKDRTFIGNPELEQARIDNYDVRVEAFPSGEEALAVSAFHKKIAKPVEYQVYQGTGSGDLVRQPFNGEEGFVRGIELESRIAGSRFWSGLSRFGFNANLTLAKSEVEIALVSNRSGRVVRPLTGQSDYVANAGIQFVSPSGRVQSALQYNVFGERLEASGPVDENGKPIVPDIYERPRHTVDFTTSARWGAARFKLALENLTGAEYVTEQGSQIAESRELGRSLSLSVGYGSR